MKKYLLLLLFTTIAIAQNPTRFPYGVQITGGQTTTSTTSKIISQETNGTLNTIDAANLPLSTATTNALELETTVSAGAVSGFTLTNNGNGTVNIASGIAYLRATNDPYATIIKYPISAVTNLTLTDNANNYVLVDYNGGSPTITVTTDGSTINTQTNSLAYVIARVGNDLEYLNLVGQNVDPNAKLRIRFLNQEGIRRASGAVLGFSNRNLTLTSSVLFSGLIRINAAAFNTASSDTFTLVYNNGSTWTRTAGQTQVNNTQYNVSGTLTTMSNNTFRTDYVYLLPNNPSKLYVVMGTTTYGSLTLARTAPTPSTIPVELQVLGLPVGRLFIEKNSATIAEVQNPFDEEFQGGTVPEHNSLSGLQGGTAGEYNHLSNAQVALVNSSEQTTNKSDSYTVSSTTTYANTKALVDGLATKLNGSSYNTTPTATAFTHYFGETASDGIIRPKTLANVKTEIVTTAAVDAAKANIVTGTGTTNTLIKWGSSSTGVNSTLFDNGGGNAGFNSSQSTPTMFRITNPNAAIGGGTKLSFYYNTETGYFQNSFDGSSFVTTLQGISGVDVKTGSTTALSIHSSSNVLIGTPTNNGNKLRVNGKVDVNELQLNTTPATASGTPPLLTWNSTTKDVESVPYATFAPQDLQSVVNEGGYAEVDGGNSYVKILVNDEAPGDAAEYYSDTYISDLVNSSEIYQTKSSIYIAQYTESDGVELNLDSGKIDLKQFNNTLGVDTTFDFETPTVSTNIKIPAPTTAGTYELALKPKTYTVGTLPTGSVGDTAYVTDALAPTYLGTLTGGGSVVCPVFYNGSAWVSH